jgi:hypothetical protein
VTQHTVKEGGEVEVLFHCLLSLALAGGGWYASMLQLLHAVATLTLDKQPSVLIGHI